ncbi:phosphotransferase [Sinomonas flava]|uniref:phosphotransferase n=1 Tax=Sinomonas flava TaxID=496857 RepID=UPI0039A68166
MPGEADLRTAVAAALACEVDGLEDVRSEALDYDAFLAHRTVRRVHGHARVDGGCRPWSLIEKTTEGPGLAERYLLDNGAREFAAYSSGLLDGLAPSVRARRLYGSHADNGGRLVLWLEEVMHDRARPLDAASLLAAARDLGAMAGSWHRRVPAEPRLFTGWIDRHSQPEAVPAGLAALSTDSREVVALLGRRLAAGRDLIAAQPRVRAILESLPQTLCHHDAVGANAFVSSGTTVLIDWESVGPGAVGADLASLLFSSVRRGDAMASVVASVLDSAVSAYTESVREQDPSVSAKDVRRGFDAAVALRWKLIADLADAAERHRPIRRGSRPDEPARESLGELVALADLLLDAAHGALDH